jgi:CotS family spore coat protein
LKDQEVEMIRNQSSEPLTEVLGEYPFTVKQIRTESYKQKKAVWWVETTKGTKILKKHPNSEAMLLFLLAAIQHLQKRGIEIPRVNTTVDGRPYVNIGETCYILIDAVEGKNPDYNKPKELEIFVRELGRFHAASAGFVPPKESKVRQHLGNWLEDYSDYASRLKAFYDGEKYQVTHGEFGKIILKVFDSFFKRMEASIAGLRGSEYTTWVNKIAAKGGLCHQDFAAGNILLNPSGKVYVLDTDSLTIDLPARDIRKVLNKVMKKNGKWDAALLQDILGWYQQENPLTADEWAVVKLDLTFPHLFAGIMDKYYRGREKDWTEGKYVSRLKEMIAIEQSGEKVLDKYNEIIKKIK